MLIRVRLNMSSLLFLSRNAFSGFLSENQNEELLLVIDSNLNAVLQTAQNNNHVPYVIGVTFWIRGAAELAARIHVICMHFAC